MCVRLFVCLCERARMMFAQVKPQNKTLFPQDIKTQIPHF